MSDPGAAPQGFRAALRHLTGESLVYGLGQVSGRAVQVLLVPLVTAVLVPEVFGVGDLVITYTAFAVMVLVFGMDGALVRFFYREEDREARRRMVSSSLAFRVATSVVLAAGLFALAEPLSALLLGSTSYAKYVRVGAATLPFTLLVLFANDVLRVTFQPWKFIALNLFNTVVVGGLTLWWVVAEGRGVLGLLAARLAGDAAAALLGLAFLRHTLAFRVDSAVLGRMLRFGAPLVPTVFFYGIVTAADRWFLQRAQGLADVGVYAVALKFQAVVMMGVSAFTLAFMPFAHARAQSPGAPRLYARVLGLYVAGATLLALAVGLFAPEILAWLVAPAYREAAEPALLLVFAAVAYGAYYVAALGLQFALRTGHLVWTALAAAVTAVVLDGWLAPVAGPTGVAVATLAANVVLTAATYAAAQAAHPLPYRGRRLLVLFLTGIALGLLAHRFAPAGAAGWAVKGAALAAFATAAWALEVWRDRGAVKAAALKDD